MIDIIPAGSELREQGQLTWSKSGMTMSLIGFNHVFADSIERNLAPGLQIKVVPLPVLALLKILAFMDNPQARQKDIGDFAELLQRYELDGDCRFSDAIFDAGVSFDNAGAFLMGMRIAQFCTPAENLLVRNFISKACDEPHPASAALHRSRSRGDDSDAGFEHLIAAFALGLEHRRTGDRS